MLLNDNSFKDLVSKWRTGKWFERLAYWLVSHKKFKCVYDSMGDYIYLVRMTILGSSTSKFALWLHFFPRGDEDRALHTHPFFFFSYVVDGSYREETLSGDNYRRKGTLVFRTVKSLHRVHTNYAWTIVLRGPKMRSWGFLVNGRIVPWRKFLGLPETTPEI